MTLNRTKEDPVTWMKRMHLFHPGRFFMIVGGAGALSLSLISIMTVSFMLF